MYQLKFCWYSLYIFNIVYFNMILQLLLLNFDKKKINYNIWYPLRLNLQFNIRCKEKLYSKIKIDSVSLKLIIENNIKHKQLSSNNIHISRILPVKWILKLAFRSSLLPLVKNLIAASFPENSWGGGMASSQYCCVEPLLMSVTYKIVSVIDAIYNFFIFNSLSYSLVLTANFCSQNIIVDIRNLFLY